MLPISTPTSHACYIPDGCHILPAPHPISFFFSPYPTRLVRFIGMEMEAAAALCSVLATESAARRAKATSIKLAHENKRRSAAAAAAIGGGESAAGAEAEGLASLVAQQQRLQRHRQNRLPLPALVAAAKSLRTLGSSALSIQSSLERAVAAGAAAAAVTAGADGALGRSGGGEARLAVGRASAARLVRYLTRQCDR